MLDVQEAVDFPQIGDFMFIQPPLWRVYTDIWLRVIGLSDTWSDTPNTYLGQRELPQYLVVDCPTQKVGGGCPKGGRNPVQIPGHGLGHSGRANKKPHRTVSYICASR